MANAQSYDSNYFTTLYGKNLGQSVFDKLRDRLILKKLDKYSFKGSLLDIGCGFGVFLQSVKQKYPNAVLFGTDISKEAIGIAQILMPEGEFRTESVLVDGITFTQKFDAITAINVVEHLEEPSKAFKTIHSKLATDGLFILHLPVINNKFNKFCYSFTYAHDKTHIYKPTAAELIKEIETAGFRLEEELYCPFFLGKLSKALKPHCAFMGVFRKI